MEGNPRYTLVVLIILVIAPVKWWCRGESLKSQREGSETALQKRFQTIDSDSFVGLMGRRGVSPARSHVDRILTELLRQSTRQCCPSVHVFLQKNGCRFIICENQRTPPSS